MEYAADWTACMFLDVSSILQNGKIIYNAEPNTIKSERSHSGGALWQK